MLSNVPRTRCNFRIVLTKLLSIVIARELLKIEPDLPAALREMRWTNIPDAQLVCI